MPHIEDLSDAQRQAMLNFACFEYDDAPFVPLRELLEKLKLGLVTTAGLHSRGDRPFSPGEQSYRIIPSVTPARDSCFAFLRLEGFRFEVFSSPDIPNDSAPSLEGAVTDVTPTRLRVVNAEELLAMDIPPREHIMEPIIHTQSANMLFAKRGVGKTYMSLGIACAVAAGSSFLRWSAPKPRKVLYIDGEMPAIRTQGP